MKFKELPARLNTPLSPGMAYLLLGVCFVFALLLRFWIGFYGSPVISRDGIEYVRIIKYWEQNGHLPMCWYISAVPFYFFRAGAWLTGSIDSGIQLSNILFGALTVFPLYGLCRAFDARRDVGVAAAFIFAVSTNFTEINTGFLRESSGLFFLVCGLCCMANGVKKDKIWWWAASGSLFMFSALCRIEFMEINLVIFLLSMLLLCFKKIKLRRLFVWAGGYLAGALATSLLVLALLNPTPKEMSLFYDLVVFRIRVNTNSNYIGKPQDVPEYYFFH